MSEYKLCHNKYTVIYEVAKDYVKQVLDAIDCEDQMNEDESLKQVLKDKVNTCFYLNMPFKDVVRLAKPISVKEKSLDEVESLYKEYIQKYIDIVKSYTTSDNDNELLSIGGTWLCITISDILDMEDSFDYPKGLRCDSDYWDIEMFENYIDEEFEEGSASAKDYQVIASFINNKMEDLRNKIYEQRRLDGI